MSASQYSSVVFFVNDLSDAREARIILDACGIDYTLSFSASSLPKVIYGGALYIGADSIRDLASSLAAVRYRRPRERHRE